jgi:hypothetical protein
MRQPTLPHVDTAARRQGRAERGPTARKRWREFRTLTATLVRAGDLEPSGWRVWYNFCDLGRLRRWWTATDVETLLRPYVLQGQPVPMVRTLIRAPKPHGLGCKCEACERAREARFREQAARNCGCHSCRLLGSAL